MAIPAWLKLLAHATPQPVARTQTCVHDFAVEAMIIGLSKQGHAKTQEHVKAGNKTEVGMSGLTKESVRHLITTPA